jgi:50S ribosomal subunit-associated GTPase HflX
MVFNKVDLVNPLWAKAIASRFRGIVCSALDQNSFGGLLKEIEDRVWPDEKQRTTIAQQDPLGH